MSASLSRVAALSRALPAPPRSRQQRNHALDLVAALGIGASMAVVGALLPAMARAEGLEPAGLAALAALPYLASLLTPFAGRIGPRRPRGMALARAAGALALLLVVLVPDPLVIALTTVVYWAAFMLGSPLQQRIWALVYPTEGRGRWIGAVGTARSAAGAAALAAIALLAAPLGADAIIAVIALGGALLILASGRIEAPGIGSGRRFGVRDSIRAATGRSTLRWVIGGQLLLGGGLFAAPALFAMVYIDRLGLSVGEVALAGVACTVATALTFGAWGRMAARDGVLTTFALGSLAGTLAVLLFAVASSVVVVLAATLLLGVAYAAIAVSWPLLIAEHVSQDEQSMASAGIDSIMGLRGLVLPFIIMAPVSAGIIGITGGLVLCALLMAAGTLVMARLSGLDVATHRLAVARLQGLFVVDGHKTARKTAGRRSVRPSPYIPAHRTDA